MRKALHCVEVRVCRKANFILDTSYTSAFALSPVVTNKNSMAKQTGERPTHAPYVRGSDSIFVSQITFLTGALL